MTVTESTPISGGSGARGTIVVSACGKSHQGRVRKDNQDRLLVADLAADLTSVQAEASVGDSIGPRSFELGAEGAILLVADGMGGRAAGGTASGLAVTSIHEAMRNGHPGGGKAPPHDFVLRLRTALEGANRTIREESVRDDRLRGMGTTATLAGILDDVVYLVQVGDSRAYLVRNGDVVRLTRDQSLVQDMIDSGVLTEDDAQNVRNNMILQALGARSSVRPAVTFHELRRDDVLLLCSDGLSQLVGDHEIRDVVSGTADCSDVCDELIGMANERGGPDNVTVLVARVTGEGLARPGEADKVPCRPYDFTER